jgi:hypothetical protein
MTGESGWRTYCQVYKVEGNVAYGPVELLVGEKTRYGWQPEAGRDVCAKHVCEVCAHMHTSQQQQHSWGESSCWCNTIAGHQHSMHNTNGKPPLNALAGHVTNMYQAHEGKQLPCQQGNMYQNT